jgi:hypothetical protein
VTRAIAHALYRVCGRSEGPFRIVTPSGDMHIDRRRRLPLLELQQAASADGPFGLDPRVPTESGHAYLAVWVYAASLDAVLARLPSELHPQIAIVSAAGTAVVWLPAAPVDTRATADLPHPLTLCAALAAALDAVPPGPEDSIPLPRADADLITIPSADATDPAALWAWASETADALARERELARAAPAQEAVQEPEPGAEPVPQPSADPWLAEPDLPASPQAPESAAEPAVPQAVPEPPANEMPTRPEPGHHDRGVEAPEAPPVAAGQGSEPPWSVPAGLSRLVEALSQRTGRDRREVVARALLAHAMATMGTAATYDVLGVRLTWDRPDGLFGLVGDQWVKIA